jgi:hypothetical protein
MPYAERALTPGMFLFPPNAFFDEHVSSDNIISDRTRPLDVSTSDIIPKREVLELLALFDRFCNAFDIPTEGPSPFYAFIPPLTRRAGSVALGPASFGPLLDFLRTITPF